VYGNYTPQVERKKKATRVLVPTYYFSSFTTSSTRLTQV